MDRVVLLITFHFSKNMFSFSKYILEWASILKMWFFFKDVFIFKILFFFGKCFHFQKVILFWKSFSISKCERSREAFFLFSEKHNCKQTFVNKNLYSHYKWLYWWGCENIGRLFHETYELDPVHKFWNSLQNTLS